MKQITSNYTSLLENLNDQTTIITPNQRLAGYLRQIYNDNQQETVFHSPDILPLETWLYRLYEIALLQQWTDKICLSDEQAIVLWEKIIITQPTAQPLLAKTHKMAVLAHNAWELLQLWQVPTKKLQHSHHADSIQFLTWLSSWQQALKKNNWLTIAELPEHLLSCLPNSYYKHSKYICLVGFNEITPVIKKLLSLFNENNISATVFTTTQNTHNAYKLNCKNNLEELTSALIFAKNTIIAEPEARIGIVIPNLQQQRSAIMSLCQKIFYPQQLLAPPEDNTYINISGGTPLSNFLIIQTIFAVLKLKKYYICITDLYWLWHSPYLNFFKHNNVRLLLAQQLQYKYGKYISHATLMQVLAQQLAISKDNYDVFPPCYQALQHPPGHHDDKKTHRQWVQIIHEYLLALGFPGQRTIVSSDAQRLHAWEEVLKVFISLDDIESTVSFSRAITQLQLLCQQKLFQAKSTPASIQILGMLEASGQEYTHLWVCNLNEGILPLTANPHPLLPIALQKQLAMPHADNLREFTFAQTMLNDFFNNSKFVVCSYSDEDNDNNLRASTLIQTIPLIDKDLLPLVNNIAQNRSVKTETISDLYGLPVDINSQVKGGSNLFKLQAICPFKAYATLRLTAKENIAPHLGLSPSSRGSIVHQALYYFYQQITSQAQLLALSQEQRAALLKQACQDALQLLYQHKPPHEHKNHYLLEATRLQKLLGIWCETEKMRPPFTIAAIEQRLEITFSDLKLDIIIDRIDKLDNGDTIIIDYKTGDAKIDDWFSTRPNEPQLPLYCSVYDSDIKAIAFAKIQPKKQAIVGVGMIAENWREIEHINKYLVTDNDPWQQQKQSWQQNLNLLATEFKQGFAAVMPKDINKTCRHCHLSSLCRIRQPIAEE